MTDPKTRALHLVGELTKCVAAATYDFDRVATELRSAIDGLGHGLQQATEAAREKQALIIELRAEIARHKRMCRSPVAGLAPDGTPSLLPALPGVEVAREHEAHAPELGQVPESLHHELLEPPGVVTVPAGVDVATVGLEFPDLPLLPAEGTSPLD